MSLKNLFTTIATTVVSTMAMVAVLTVSSGACAQSLEDALTAAYTNNPALHAERATLRMTDEGVAQAISNWRPSVKLTASTGRAADKSSTGTGRGTDRKPGVRQYRSPGDYQLALSQPLFRGGRTLAETSAAENSVMGARARLTAVEQQILLDAAVSYLDIVRDAAVLELNINNEAVHTRHLEATQDRFQVGEITRTDVHQAEARLARATADRVQSETTLQISRSAYLNITGEVAPSALSMPPLPDQHSGVPGSRDTAITEAVDNNPLVISAQYEERAAADTFYAVRGELLPTVGFTATTAHRSNATGASTSSDSHEARIDITVPLYQSGAVYSRLRAARQLVARRQLDVEQVRRNVTEESTTAWARLASAEARVESFRTAIQAARVAFDGVEREASVGSRTVLDVLDAEQEQLDARVSFIRARHDEAVAIFQLLSAVGRMTAQHMQLPVAFYSPGDHYNEVRSKWIGGAAHGDP